MAVNGGAGRIPSWRLAAYGALAVPLAMAALPIYVHVPKFYADTLGLDLTAIGGLLLVARLLDAVQDPLLGHWSDRTRDAGRGRAIWVLIGTPLLALGMVGLFRPPDWTGQALGGWFLGMLVLVYLAFSMVQISYQAHGAEVSDHPLERTRVTAFREGLGLIGVFLAAALPQVLTQSAGPREGYARFVVLFVGLLLLAMVLTTLASPRAVVRDAAPPRGAFAAMLGPLRNARFRRLLAILVFNGIAAAIPATLVLFFIEDIVKRPDWTAVFLITYFAAGALGMPVWLRLSARLGKGRAWGLGMAVSIVAFVWAFLLGPGDALPFLAICALSGLGLGADLALPPSILADVIDVDERAGDGRREGAYFGLWNLVLKLNLALAAGIALPALAWAGYVPSGPATASSLTWLSAIYALLPCALKAIAVAVLLASPFVRTESPKEFPR